MKIALAAEPLGVGPDECIRHHLARGGGQTIEPEPAGSRTAAGARRSRPSA